MTVHVIKMPDIGEGIVEVELVAWRVKPGDTVAEDQILADVMTDKATVEIPSPVVGTVLALGGEAGQLMAVGSELIRLEVAGGAAASVAAAPAPAPAPVAAPAPAVVAPAPASQPPAPAPAQTAVASAPPASGERPIASPSVRRRAWELGVDLQQVRPTGSGGRVMHGDVEAHAATHGTRAPAATPAASPAATAAAGAAPAPAAARTAYAASAQPRNAPSGVPREGEESIKLVGMRRVIAQKMQESKRRIPHFSYVEEVDVTELEALRASLNSRHAATRGKLTVLPLLVRAVVLALRDFPQINARLDDEQGVVTRYQAVHLGVAAQTKAGLMVPVLRHAEAHDLWSSAAEIARLADAARAGRATRDELTGSTITISSLGPLGGIVTTPVINMPEVAIIGVNRIVERPMFQKGQLVARQMMNLSSSFDHRVVDGQDAAEFIQAIRALLETPALLFIE